MQWNRLHPRAQTLFYGQAAIRFLVWVGVTVVGASVLASFWTLKGALIAAVVWLAIQAALSVVMPTLSFQRWAYTRREHDLLIARGVLVRTVTSVPVLRVQHVDVRQGPLERSLGLARLAIYTASGSGADGVLPGLLLADAEALRDSLIDARGDDGV